MIYAEKANKTLKIEESEKDSMQAQGFDIVEVDGKGNKTILAVGHGKTVPYEKYAELEKKVEALEKELAKLKKPAKEPEKEAKE